MPRTTALGEAVDLVRVRDRTILDPQRLADGCFWPAVPATGPRINDLLELAPHGALQQIDIVGHDVEGVRAAWIPPAARAQKEGRAWVPPLPDNRVTLHRAIPSRARPV